MTRTSYLTRYQKARTDLEALHLAPAMERAAVFLLGKLNDGHLPEKIERAGGAAQFSWQMGEREMTVLIGARER